MTISIDVKNVSMKYRLNSEKVDSLKQYFVKRSKKEIKYKEFIALSDINFSVQRGEVFGIIGMNGAGKSTLLKIIAGIIKPSEGNVYRYGSVAPLIELGGGFNGELTGIENIYLNGLLLGHSRKLISSKLEEISSFSELGEFLHVPLKNYSSGMKARLGFSIATVVEPDILIVDEALSVGDIQFKTKSERKIMNMIDSGTTVLFVSHSLEQVQKLCKRVMWLDKGRIQEIGLSAEVCKNFKNAKSIK
ncbi:ABC transporter ATP-binding protein [Paenibacillus motobuensis]|uniref:ABC transporter ATP-binding protein n=1 Tax=Paenibacillus motobuensis TaxID=295324 RepID=A0ABP3HS08_9BACL